MISSNINILFFTSFFPFSQKYLELNNWLPSVHPLVSIITRRTRNPAPQVLHCWEMPFVNFLLEILYYHFKQKLLGLFHREFQGKKDTLCLEDMFLDTLCLEDMLLDTLCLEDLVLDTSCLEDMFLDTLCLEDIFLDTLCLEDMFLDTLCLEDMFLDIVLNGYIVFIKLCFKFALCFEYCVWRIYNLNLNSFLVFFFNWCFSVFKDPWYF